MPARLDRPVPLSRSGLSPGLRIGILGGSFNPAHDGHVHISRLAKARLDLDQVWWLVSPQNPLKARTGMKPLAERLRLAEALDLPHFIRVTDLETRLGTRYTADTLAKLHRRYPGLQFVWLMGADNLAQIHRWKRWHEIFTKTPIAVIDRPSYANRSLSAPGAMRFAASRHPAEAAATLPGRKAPAWCFLHVRTHPASATAIRARSSAGAASAGAASGGPKTGDPKSGGPDSGGSGSLATGRAA